MRKNYWPQIPNWPEAWLDLRVLDTAGLNFRPMEGRLVHLLGRCLCERLHFISLLPVPASILPVYVKRHKSSNSGGLVSYRNVILSSDLVLW